MKKVFLRFNRDIRDIYVKGREYEVLMRDGDLIRAKSEIGIEFFDFNVNKRYFDVVERDDPATFEAHNQTWFAHTPGDPMPCDGHCDVHVLRKDQSEKIARVSQLAKAWGWGIYKGELAGANIIGWRFADQEPMVSGECKATDYSAVLADADESGLDTDQFPKFAWLEFLVAVAPDVPAMKDESLPTRQRRHWNEMEERQAQKEQAAAAQAELKKSEQAKALQEAADAMGKVSQDHPHRLGWLS